MSHVTDVKLKIHDIDALEEAVDKLGMILQRGQKTYQWYGRFMNDSSAYGGYDPKDFGKCEHAIRRKDHQAGDYEIGVVNARDGNGYELLVDTWGPGGKLVAAGGGRSLDGIRREYAASVATRKAVDKLSRHGWRVVREELPGNNIRLKLRKR